MTYYASSIIEVKTTGTSTWCREKRKRESSSAYCPFLSLFFFYLSALKLETATESFALCVQYNGYRDRQQSNEGNDAATPAIATSHKELLAKEWEYGGENRANEDSAGRGGGTEGYECVNEIDENGLKGQDGAHAHEETAQQR